MGEVFLDGERVDFQGPAPGGVAEAWTIVEGYLAGIGRAIASAEADGREWNPQGEDVARSYERLAFRSESQAARLASLVSGWLSERVATLRAIEGLSSFVLCHSWAQTQERTIETMQGFRPLLEGFEFLATYGVQRERGWTQEAVSSQGASVEALSRVMQCLELRDCAGLSEALALDLGPALSNCFDVLEQAVAPDLAKEAKA